MDSDDEFGAFDDPESEGGDSDELFGEMGMESEAAARDMHRADCEEFHFEVMTADQLVQYMVDSIKEVNTVIQVFHKCLYVCQSLMKVFIKWLSVLSRLLRLYFCMVLSSVHMCVISYRLQRHEYCCITSDGTKKNLWNGEAYILI